MSIPKLIFETFYMLTIMVGGVGSGILLSKVGLYYLYKQSGFMINSIYSHKMNTDGYYEIVPTVPSNPSDLR